MDTSFDQVKEYIFSVEEPALNLLQACINDQRRQLARLKMTQMRVGTRVKYNSKTQPRYLIDKLGTVTKVMESYVMVKMDEVVQGPSGKAWGRGDVRTPVNLLDIIEDRHSAKIAEILGSVP